MFKKMNINDKVKVKLTVYGLCIMRQDWEQTQRSFPKLGPWQPPKIDEEGYTEFQLWCLMEHFGHFICFGNPEIPFDTNILVEIQ